MYETEVLIKIKFVKMRMLRWMCGMIMMVKLRMNM